MRLRQFILLVIMSIGTSGLIYSPAQAFFGFGNDNSSKIGLDLVRGYDVNTVTTIIGQVVSTPHVIETGHVIIEIQKDHEIINLCVGPYSYWDINGIKLNMNDNITAKGSNAQGKDGKSYVLIQKISNRTTGKQVVLRNEKGEPVWPGGEMVSMKSSSDAEGMGGVMMHGGSGMLRSIGGGIMHR